MKSDMVSGYLVSIHKSYLMGLVVTTTYPSSIITTNMIRRKVSATMPMRSVLLVSILKTIAGQKIPGRHRVHGQSSSWHVDGKGDEGRTDVSEVWQD